MKIQTNIIAEKLFKNLCELLFFITNGLGISWYDNITYYTNYKPNPVFLPVRKLMLFTGYTTARYLSRERSTNVYIETYIATGMKYWLSLQPMSPVGQSPTYWIAVGGRQTSTKRRSAIAKF